MVPSGPGQVHIHVHPALLKTHFHGDSVDAAPNSALTAEFCSSPPSEAIILFEIIPSVECSRESRITLLRETASSVHTLALPVRLDHWIQCHFLYTNAKKVGHMLLASDCSKKKKSPAAFCTVNVNTTCPCTFMWMQFILNMVVGKKVYLKQPAAPSR